MSILPPVCNDRQFITSNTDSFCSNCVSNQIRLVPKNAPYTPMKLSLNIVYGTFTCLYFNGSSPSCNSQPVFKCTPSYYLFWSSNSWLFTQPEKYICYPSGLSVVQLGLGYGGRNEPLSILIAASYDVKWCLDCVKCHNGTYVADCSPLSSGVCNTCLSGAYTSFMGASMCSECTPGTYSTALGAITSDTCLFCPPNTYSEVFAASTSKTCLDCPKCAVLPGQFNTCGRGTAGNCSMCSNTLSTSTAYYLETISYNSSCPSKTPTKGSFRSCTNPRAPMQIFYMTFKTTFLDFGSFCTFQGTWNNQPYYLCTASDFSPYYVWWQNTQWMGSALLGNMDSAAAGPEVDGNTYVSGEYQPITALYSNLLDNSAVWEIPCSPGSYSATDGSTACTLASTGYYVSSSGSSSQTPCSASLFSYVGASVCTASCPSGTYRAASGSQCLAVSPGSYSITGILTPCPKGTYSNLQGATACTNCIAGQYNSGTGMDSPTSCVLCAQGTYASSAASPNCISVFTVGVQCTACT